MDVLAIYSRANHKVLLTTAGVSACLIAVVDWYTRPYLSIGFLYLFPILLVSGMFRRWQILLTAAGFAILQELFSNLPLDSAIARLAFSYIGFAGTGLFVSEVLRNRRMVLAHLDEVRHQIQQRREAEEQLQILVDSSPAAILTVGSSGEILLSNGAAQELLACDGTDLRGQQIADYIPTLSSALRSGQSHLYRTAIQCRAQRAGGEAFLAGAWFSTYRTESGSRLAAIIVDLSEELCSREDLSLDYLLKNARILMSAVSHEIRNLAGAALVLHENLTRVTALKSNEDFEALGTLIHGLEKLSALELSTAPDEERQIVELAPVLDEIRVLIETICRNAEIQMEWVVTDILSSVWGERYGLIQVFLNLAKNSRRALESVSEKRIRISAECNHQTVTIHFEDTGPGISDPQMLFRAFQRDASATGLGLYVSRALLRNFGGDLSFERSDHGCRFAVTLQTA